MLIHVPEQRPAHPPTLAVYNCPSLSSSWSKEPGQAFLSLPPLHRTQMRFRQRMILRGHSLAGPGSLIFPQQLLLYYTQFRFIALWIRLDLCGYSNRSERGTQTDRPSNDQPITFNALSRRCWWWSAVPMVDATHRAGQPCRWFVVQFPFWRFWLGLWRMDPQKYADDERGIGVVASSLLVVRMGIKCYNRSELMPRNCGWGLLKRTELKINN